MENTNLVAASAATVSKANNEEAKTFAWGTVTVYDTLPDRLLTEHFCLREFIISAAAVRHGIDNMPTDEAVANLKALCREVLEPLRRRFGVIRITSGYRSERVNRLVGGKPTSQHMRGEAADISLGSMEVGMKMYEYIRAHMTFDQLIFERNRKTGARWLHVSYRRDGHNRRQALMLNV